LTLKGSNAEDSGFSLASKVGAKARGLRLVDDGHNLDCKIEGIGAIKLELEFVKKA